MAGHGARGAGGLRGPSRRDGHQTQPRTEVFRPRLREGRAWQHPPLFFLAAFTAASRPGTPPLPRRPQRWPAAGRRPQAIHRSATALPAYSRNDPPPPDTSHLDSSPTPRASQVGLFASACRSQWASPFPASTPSCTRASPATRPKRRSPCPSSSARASTCWSRCRAPSRPPDPRARSLASRLPRLTAALRRQGSTVPGWSASTTARS